MFKIFKGLYYKDCNSEEITDLINAINEDSSEFNNFLLFHLEVIDHSIKKLSESETSVLELSAIKQLVGTLYLAKKIEVVFNERLEDLKIPTSEKESIKLNGESIVNGIEKVAEYNKKNMMATDSSTLLIYLSLS